MPIRRPTSPRPVEEKFPAVVRTTLIGRNLDAEVARRVYQHAGWMGFSGLGEVTGVHPETVRRYLDGRTRIPITFVARLAECLGLSVDWVVFGDRPPPRPFVPARAPGRESSPRPEAHTAPLAAGLASRR